MEAIIERVGGVDVGQATVMLFSGFRTAEPRRSIEGGSLGKAPEAISLRIFARSSVSIMATAIVAAIGLGLRSPLELGPDRDLCDCDDVLSSKLAT